MSGLAAPVALGLTILLDVGGQLLFKLGLDGDESQAQPERGLIRRVLGSPTIAGGVALYAVEFGCWLFVLSRLDLSLAFPIATLSYVGVVLASRLFLREAVSPRRWIATLLIAAGAACIGMSA
ncbi:hypothetical protein NS365_15585 [Aureimonas ureilytica]|uniref:EamA domain-containing protein n=1 Tax=Aureimonas ureilytica TaxID=401562 RepID=A0A175RND3_9HYPH|nr:EamA family transporter [Aureimonas ureilytica]KTR04299.1 hypothetical protein NS365_15585 [Aureimonas ureilytica]